MDAPLNLASSYARLKDFDNAIAYYERAIELNPADNQFNRSQQFQHDKGTFFLFDQTLIALNKAW